MLIFIVCLLHRLVGSVENEVHSLEYIYTAMSEPVGLPGIHEFTAMGLLDDKQIDYYNSQDKRKIPTQTWMEKSLDQSYWEKGTQSRKSKEQWFKVNINILMERMRHNSTGVRVLQWRHGCVGERQPGGKLNFKKGFDEYSYDGRDFLSFDENNSRWIAPVSQAEPTKKKWDDSHTLNQYTKGYLEKECMDWLDKFMTFGEEELKNHSPPSVFTYAKKSNSADKMNLHCLATGFYPKDVIVEIYRNGVIMTEGDGVKSTGVRPNGVRPDGTVDTYQMRKSVEIFISDKKSYSCQVDHRSLREPVIAIWNGKCLDCGSTGIIVGVLAVLFLLVLVAGGLGYYLYKRRRAGDGRATAPANGAVPNQDKGHGNPEEQMVLLSGDGPAALPANGVNMCANGTVQVGVPAATQHNGASVVEEKKMNQGPTAEPC